MLLAHTSDWHTTQLRADFRELRSFIGKRGIGWLSWWLRRRQEYRPELLGLLLGDLVAREPDHIAVTGDLTHLGLEAELLEAATWLAQLGPPDRVSLVPGNHDAYCGPLRGRGLEAWLPYLRGSEAGREGPAALPEAPNFVTYPSLSICDGVALIGLASPTRSSLPVSWGRIGGSQLERLDALLAELERRELCRVVLVHHPPLPHMVSADRRLLDTAALGDVLRRRGAELLLHGHLHRTCFQWLEGPAGSIPSVGVRSGSARGKQRERRAQYHLYRIERSGAGFRIGLEIRGLAPYGDDVLRLGGRSL